MTTAVVSNFLENKIIDHTLRNTQYTSSGTSIYLALYLSDPTDADTGSEVTGTNYVRQNVTAWDAPASRQTQNTNAINYPAAGNDWGTVTHVGIRDSLAAGNLLFYGQLSSSKLINNGDTFSISAGQLIVGFSGSYSTYLAHALLSHILRNTAYTRPTGTYSSLHLGDPTPDNIGLECTGTSYVRKGITAWDSPVNGETQNTNVETFASAGGNWGTLTHTAIYDASTAGNMLYFGTLDASKTVNSGDTFRWNSGSLNVNVT